MKKSLLALAVLSAFAGVASAQSSITLYGRVDAGYTRFDPSEGNLVDQDATSGLSSGNLGGSRWGIRGTEDLGGGLKGLFVLESGFNTDDGMSGQGGRLFGRQAYLGLSSNLGTLVFGRLASFSSGTGDFDKIGFLDPFRTGANSLGWQATFSSMNALRLDNAVAYVTPNWGGFSAGVGYTFRAAGQEQAGGSDANNTGVISYINYSNGPFYGVVTYDTFDLGELVNEPSQDHLQVGVSWDFKIFKLSAAYAQESEQYALGPAGMAFGTPSATANTAAAVQVPGTDATAWAIGAIIPFGAHRINLSYQNRSADSLGAVGEGNRDGYALGYEYSFSRRTTLYVYYGEVSDDDTYKSGNWGGIKQTFLGLSHTF